MSNEAEVRTTCTPVRLVVKSCLAVIWLVVCVCVFTRTIYGRQAFKVPRKRNKSLVA
jgi:beta-lactamase regulating signal transducer with metallopeptidase domain